MIKIAICEDEKDMQDILDIYLHKILNKREYEIQIYSSGEELLDSDLSNIDILLLDIQMNELNGMDTARRIRKIDNRIEIIFITSLIDYVQEGYEVRAYRYLLKPIGEKDLEQHVLACIDGIEKNRDRFVLIKNKANLYKIYEKDIKYIEIQKKDMTIYSVDKTFEVKYSLEKIEKELDTNKFIRCHKSYLVNLSYVENVKQNYIILDTSEEVPVSRYRYKEVKEKFFRLLGDEIC